VASRPLPGIPVDLAGTGTLGQAAPPADVAAPASGTTPPEPGDGQPAEGGRPSEGGQAAARHRHRRRERKPAMLAAEDEDLQPRSSRLGGIILIGVVALVIVGVIVYLLAHNSGDSSHRSATPAASVASTPSAASQSSTVAGATTTSAQILAQINLTPPQPASRAAGIAEVLREGTVDGIAIVAQNVPANTSRPPNAYAVWLYNSPSDARILGFVNPGVGANGRFSTASRLPAGAVHYQRLIVTLETSATPKAPGQIVLEGPLTGL